MDSNTSDGLFDESLLGRVMPDATVIEAGAGIHKRFKAFDPDAVMMVPPSLDEWLPQTHLSRFIADIVEKVECVKFLGRGFFLFLGREGFVGLVSVCGPVGFEGCEVAEG